MAEVQKYPIPSSFIQPFWSDTTSDPDEASVKRRLSLELVERGSPPKRTRGEHEHISGKLKEGRLSSDDKEQITGRHECDGRRTDTHLGLLTPLTRLERVFLFPLGTQLERRRRPVGIRTDTYHKGPRTSIRSRYDSQESSDRTYLEDS